MEASRRVSEGIFRRLIDVRCKRALGNLLLEASVMLPNLIRSCSLMLAAFAAMNGAATAADQALPPPVILTEPAASPWEFTIAGYLWGAGMKGDIATLPPLPATSVDIGFDDVIRNLNGAFMAAGEIRKDRFLVALDVMYTRLGGTVGTKGPFLGSVTLDTSSFVGTLLAGYRIADAPTYSLDLMAGVRGYSVWTRLMTSSVIPALNLRREHTEEWIDPMIGTRVRIHLDPKWYVTGWGFVGGFGVSSKSSWDVMGGIGYSFSNYWAGVLGYRALGVDYANGAFVYNIVQHGPLLALVARF
jgi:hypothetical protein